MELKKITESIIGAAIEVHRTLGPGLLESTYHTCLARKMSLRGLGFQQQMELPISYKGIQLDCGYRLDFRVENAVIVELKSVEELLPIHEAQLLPYLKRACCKIGLLINFNVPILKKGIKRMIL